jgi:hypothetical protein
MGHRGMSSRNCSNCWLRVETPCPCWLINGKFVLMSVWWCCACTRDRTPGDTALACAMRINYTMRVVDGSGSALWRLCAAPLQRAACTIRRAHPRDVPGGTARAAGARHHCVAVRARAALGRRARVRAQPKMIKYHVCCLPTAARTYAHATLYCACRVIQSISREYKYKYKIYV